MTEYADGSVRSLADTNGYADIAAYDSDGDGVAEAIAEDTDCDGDTDVVTRT